MSVLVGLLATGGGLVYTARQWETQSQGQFADRYTKGHVPT